VRLELEGDESLVADHELTVGQAGCRRDPEREGFHSSWKRFDGFPLRDR
jgi:hypothetical protein